MYDLEELLHLKKQQINKYRYKLFPKSSYYRHYLMVKSFL